MEEARHKIKFGEKTVKVMEGPRPPGVPEEGEAGPRPMGVPDEGEEQRLLRLHPGLREAKANLDIGKRNLHKNLQRKMRLHAPCQKE